MNFTEWSLGQKVPHLSSTDPTPYTVVDIIPFAGRGVRGRGVRSVVATIDGKPGRLGVRCTCGGETPNVAAYDLVTEMPHTICGNCRMVKITH